MENALIMQSWDMEDALHLRRTDKDQLDLADIMIDETWDELCRRDPDAPDKYPDWHGEVEIDHFEHIYVVRIYE